MPTARSKTRESLTARVSIGESIMRVNEINDGFPSSDGPRRKGRKSHSTRETNMKQTKIPDGRANQKERSPGELSDIRKKVESGVYTNPAYAEKIVNKIIDEHALEGDRGPGDSITESPDDSDKASGVRRDRVDEVRKKVSVHDYSDSEVLERIVDRLMKQFGIR